MGQAEQAGAKAGGDAHLVTEDGRGREIAQTAGRHDPVKGAGHRFPPPRPGSSSAPAAGRDRGRKTSVSGRRLKARGYDDRHDPASAVRWACERSIGFNSMNKKTTRRGNYESGSDYVLEYGELRFAFNEEDFGQRVEQAAVKLGFVQQGLSREELDDLLDLAVNGEISEPTSELGEHINVNWEDLVGPSNRSLVHWLRRLVFRGAWLDQRVKEGELDVVFDGTTQTFGYVQPDRSNELIELSKEPSWRRIAYRR
jgi:hypothetical protein